jgi:hypothetical protein
LRAWKETCAHPARGLSPPPLLFSLPLTLLYSHLQVPMSGRDSFDSAVEAKALPCGTSIEVGAGRHQAGIFVLFGMWRRNGPRLLAQSGPEPRLAEPAIPVL